MITLPRRRALPFAVGAAVVLASAVVGGWRFHGRSSASTAQGLHSSMGALASLSNAESRTPAAAGDSLRSVGGVPIRGVLLLQLSDCTGNLRLLDLTHRVSVRHAISLDVLWNVGAAGDSARMRTMLPRWTRAIPIRPAPPEAIAELARLGHVTSPMLVLLDQAGRVRLVTQSPASSRELAGLRRAIEGLAWFDDL